MALCVHVSWLFEWTSVTFISFQHLCHLIGHQNKDKSRIGLRLTNTQCISGVVLFKSHRAVVKLSWAVRSVRSLSTFSRLLTGIQILARFKNWCSNNKMTLLQWSVGQWNSCRESYPLSVLSSRPNTNWSRDFIATGETFMLVTLQQELKFGPIEFQNQQAVPVRSLAFWPVDGRPCHVSGSIKTLTLQDWS